MFIHDEIDRLQNKKRTVGLDLDEEESLCEYIGRSQSIEAERNYLNGGVEMSPEAVEQRINRVIRGDNSQ